MGPNLKPDTREICFVMMPFGRKEAKGGRWIDFDAVYSQLVAPAIEASGLRPLRSDEETRGGIIHKQMLERLLLCPYAVADLTTANANVFYEMGVRHAARPHTSVLIFSDESDLKFDLQNQRSFRYSLDAHGQLDRLEADRAALQRTLAHAQQPMRDSPVFEFFQEHYKGPELAHSVTDSFHEQVRYGEEAKRTLESIRARFQAGVRRRAGEDTAVVEARKAGVRAELERFAAERAHAGLDAGTRIAILLTWRACDGHGEMVQLVEALPEHLREQKLVQEQYAFALNRLRRRGDAQRVLERVIHRFGADAETCGLLGRVFKDRWSDAIAEQRPDDAEAELDRAIETYTRGFEADIRDFYPGVNAVTLLDIAGREAERDVLLPVVRYAAERRIRALPPDQQDYWEHATVFELAVIAGDRERAVAARKRARTFAKEPWMTQTTGDQLRLIAQWRRARGKAELAEWTDREAAAIEA